jgi:hypothetical protein
MEEDLFRKIFLLSYFIPNVGQAFLFMSYEKCIFFSFSDFLLLTFSPDRKMWRAKKLASLTKYIKIFGMIYIYEFGYGDTHSTDNPCAMARFSVFKV